MNGKGIAGAAAALGLLAALLLALPAQAQYYTCDNLKGLVRDGVPLLFEEQVWFNANCAEEEEEDDDDDLENLRDLISAPRFSPPVMTCPTLPPSVTVTGYSEGTQCQLVDTNGIGRMELIERGFITAVDVWGFVNGGGVEVCFAKFGELVFLDAAYTPRMIMDLASYERAGMTCGKIDRVGTVALIKADEPAAPAVASPPAQPTLPTEPTPPTQPTLPTFDVVPLRDCLIKLVETLYLRAQPAGEIIGLVWLNSEVSAYEINGYWYKIEFEGKFGYISRYHRKVLRGGCG